MVAAVLLCLPLLASAADLSVKLTLSQFPVTPVAVGDSLFWDTDVRNVFGPAAQNVTVTFRPTPELQLDPINFFPTCSGNPVIRCTFATLSPGQSVSLRISGKAVAAGFGELIVIAEEDGLNDPTPSDNFASSSIEIKSDHRLSVACRSPQFVVEPNIEAVATCDFVNTGLNDGHDVTVTIELTGDATLAGPPAGHQTNCVVDPDGNRIVCVTPLLLRGGCCGSSVDLRVRAPDKTSGQFGVHAVLTSSDAPFSDAVLQSIQTWSLPLSFVVTNTDDDGGGSLRQAIRDANAACNSKPLPDECLVSFHIPSSLASGGVFTIRPRTPLPPLTGERIVVGGDSQRLFAGDSNPKGPEIEINGSRLDSGDGFDISSEHTLRELTINGFPGPGIAITGGPICCGGVVISNCYIGTDASGMRAVPNQRGIVGNLHALINDSSIENNVISGNRFSGIFIGSPTQFISIMGNIIGAGADGVTPLGNGASGIYTADFVGSPGQGEIDDNLIAYNKQWGIAIANGSSANMHRNRFVANGYPGIDHGFDLSIATSGADAGRYPNAPLLVAAHYDPVSGNTIITGHLEAQAEAGLVGENYSLELFASDSAGDSPQAERFLRVIFVNPGDFTVSVPGDLTGQGLTGTISRTRFTAFTDPEGFPAVASHEETSDLGPPLKVSP